MNINVGMPKFGLSMEEGTLSVWLVKEGDAVKKGDPIAEIQSEKLSNNAVAPCDGTLVKILLREGESAFCGNDICVIECTGEEGRAVPAQAFGEPKGPKQSATVEKRAPLLSVRAKTVAHRAGIDASEIVGSGENGMVLIDDVRRAMEAPAVQMQVAGTPAEISITPRAKKYADQAGLAYAHIKGSGLLGMITLEDVKAHGRSAAQAPAAEASVMLAEQAPMLEAPEEISITPRAKKYAEQVGLSYAHIKGSGLLGMITLEDVKAHGQLAVQEEQAARAQAAPAAITASAVSAQAAPGDEVILMTGIQRATAAAMMKSLRESAQTTVMAEAFVAPLKKLYEQLKPKYFVAGVKLSYTALIVKAVAMALEEGPDIRMQVYDERHFRLSTHIGIGVAVDAPAGLFVPVIRNANLKDIRTISLELEDLGTRTRAGKLTEGDMGGACMTISNLGMFGVTGFTPVLNPPESVILGVCAMVEKPVARDGGIRIEPTMSLCLTYDHRVINGAPASRFLQQVIQNLNEFAWI